IDEFPEVHQGIVLMGRPDENRQGDRGRVQADGLFHRGRDLLIRQVLVQDARPATHPEHDRDIRPRIDRGADYASGDHDGIREGKERLQGLPRDPELVGGAEEISVVGREHDRVAVFGADDPRKTILKSPRHLVTSWSKSLELVSRINPFAARLGWQRHGPGTVICNLGPLEPMSFDAQAARRDLIRQLKSLARPPGGPILLGLARSRPWCRGAETAGHRRGIPKGPPRHPCLRSEPPGVARVATLDLRRSPTAVSLLEAFLRDHALGLPAVTITVATERASKAFRAELREKRRPEH